MEAVLSPQQIKNKQNNKTTQGVLLPAKTRPKAFSDPVVDSPVLLRGFCKLFLPVSDVSVQLAGDEFERVPATRRSSPAGLNSAEVHARGKPRLEAGRWWCQEVGCTSLTPPPPMTRSNLLAPSHQIEESSCGASQRMFILQANSQFMLIFTSQRGSCKREKGFFFFFCKKFPSRLNHSLNTKEEPS